jgi:adenosylmethionine-8-amino-7-oxononanoate aminotransferase
MSEKENLTSPAELLEQDQQYVWHPFTPLVGMQPPLTVTHASGVYLHIEGGRKIIDSISSWWVNLHGHSHPHIAQAVASQATSLEHVIFAGFTHEPAVKLARRLIEILPDNQSKIFYSDNGSTAVEVAMKMAFQYWFNKGVKKPRIVAIDGAYHGDTFGAMSVGDRSPFNNPFAPYLFQVDFLEFPSAAKEEAVVARFRELAVTGEVAAFIYEPLIQGSSGMRMYSEEVLDQLLQIARQHQILCIADEVMTGFGRTGKLFASQYLQQQPDIMCLSKGLTGGTLPLGVTSCTEDIIEAYRSQDIYKTFFHGHSFTANPIACAAANASLDLLLTDKCTANISSICNEHQKFAEKIRGLSAVKEVRILGTIIAIEVNTTTATSYFNEARNNLYYYFLEKNVLLRPLGNVIYILPPYIINKEELKVIYDTIADYLKI